MKKKNKRSKTIYEMSAKEQKTVIDAFAKCIIKLGNMEAPTSMLLFANPDITEFEVETADKGVRFLIHEVPKILVENKKLKIKLSKLLTH